MNFAQILSETFVFKSLPASELKKLAQAATEEHLPNGSTLFREGDRGEQMYVIAMGTVRVLKRNRDGVEEEIAVLGTGSYVGEMALVAEDHVRTATILGQESTTLLVLERADIERLCEQDDKLAHHFYRALSRGLVRRLHATSTDAAYYKSLSKRR